MRETKMPRITPGRWMWMQSAHGPYLRTEHSGGLVVMDFARLGMRHAQPRFSDRNGDRKGGRMIDAATMGDGLFDHADARVIEAAPELLELVYHVATMGAAHALNTGDDFLAAAARAANGLLARLTEGEVDDA